ncbi:DUF2637 domain-containing protein [Kitasatospora sp. NPDC058965]|uniref:DUF2637 domain-containing protein n=1 Tax=Kitasatospora sp. NPDC058965 TaxID=3346682 RepID=UPI0036B523D8
MISIVAVGATIVALIGLAGSYMAVRHVAAGVGMGRFSYAFPIGVDAGILVILGLDLVLTWLRIPFPLLRPTAWGLTVATIAFNAAASWPDPLGTGMHAVIPILFIIISEATRHAIAQLARLSSDKTIEKIRLMRWLLAPRQTWAMWRRMQLWEIRSVDEAVLLEQARLAYLTLLTDAPVGPKGKLPAAAHLPLKLAELGVPIEVTYADGLAAAGVASRPLDRIFAAREKAAGGRPHQQAEMPAGTAQHLPTVAAPRKELAPAEDEIAPAAIGEPVELMRAQPEGEDVAGAPHGRPAALRETALQSYAGAGPSDPAFAGVGGNVPQGQVPPQADLVSSQVSTLAEGFAGAATEPVTAVRAEQRPGLAVAAGRSDALDSRTLLAGAGGAGELVQEAAAVLAETTRPEMQAGAPPEADQPTSDVADQALAAGIPPVWTNGFAAWVAEHGRYPEREELAQHLYQPPFNLRARGKNEPVSLRSVERYYNDLKALFPLQEQDQEQLQLESASV